MENFIETIRASITSGATDDARTAGAQACRALLAALETKEGEPLVAPGPLADSEALATLPPVPAPPQAAAVHAIVSALRGMQPEQLLDLAIARLSAALPAGTSPPAVRPLQFHILPIPGPGVKS